MKFAIISHVPHGMQKDTYFAYSPYVREMNIWLKFVSEVEIVAPLELLSKSAIHIDYEHSNIKFTAVKQMDLLTIHGKFKSILNTPQTVIAIFKAMRDADHIHLRCPGNIGLIGCFVQILFPKKSKTAKYAGNWDPTAKQPLSYRIQKWVLNNAYLTRNMQALVYGDWPGTSKNIKGFFTATYSEAEKKEVTPRLLKPTIKCLFVGTLSVGKRPLYAIQIVEKIRKSGRNISLDLFGQGPEIERLREYCTQNRLNDIVFFQGNQVSETVKIAYQQSHFLILPSKSEGWPKAIAEAMFWGCLPVASAVSCIPYMVDYGERGLLLELNIAEDVRRMEEIIDNQSDYNDKVLKSIAWSRQFTLDLFQNEIQALLNQ